MIFIQVALGLLVCISGACAAAQFTVDHEWRYMAMASIMGFVGVGLIIDAAVWGS